MQFDFNQAMKNSSDEELIQIVVYERDNYQEAAIKAAEIELEKRNLNQTDIYSAQDAIEAKYEQQLIKAEIPLDTHWKILTFIFPGILQIILSGTFKSEGYDRKASELVKWTLFGFGFYVLVILILSNL